MSGEGSSGNGEWEYIKADPKAKLICRNNHIGTVSITLLFRVKGQSKLDAAEMQV